MPRTFALLLAGLLAACDAPDLGSLKGDGGRGPRGARELSSLGPDAAKRIYYQFTDERGRVRFVERLDEVPEAWRGRVGFVELDVPPPLSPGDARRAREAKLARLAPRTPTRRLPDGVPEVRTPTAAVVLYYADWCGWCKKAKQHLDEKGISYTLRNVDNPAILQELVAKTGQRGIPVIEVGGKILKGFDPRRLDEMLGA